MSVRTADRLEVQPHPRGPWLVRVGTRALAVPPELGRALQPLHGQPVTGGEVSRRLAGMDDPGPRPAAGAVAIVAGWLAGDGAPSGRARRGGLRPSALTLRVPLLPAALVGRVAARLAPATASGPLTLTAAAGLTTALCLRPWAGSHPLSPAALLLFAVGALWHEFGHAAALRREGYAPGGIGIAVLVCVPVLYADVGAVSLLPRNGRLRVDLAGLAFQAGATGALALLAAAPAVPTAWAAAARAAALASLLALGWGLLPLPRSDGTWALRDALDGVDPAGRFAGFAIRSRATLTIAHHLLAGLLCAVLPARLVSLVAGLAGQLDHPLTPTAHARGVTALTILAGAAWAWHAGCAMSYHARGLRMPGGRVTTTDDRLPDDSNDEPTATPLALDGVLDLHRFAPAEARDLVDDWLDASHAAGLLDLRIIHGKGIGAMRELVHAALAARDDVESYALATDASSWGATVIRMKP